MADQLALLAAPPVPAPPPFDELAARPPVAPRRARAAAGPVCLGCVFPPIVGCGGARHEANDGRDPRLRWCCDRCAALAAEQVPGMVGPRGLRTLLPVDLPRGR